MRVGLLGGSFNPAHEGHAHVADTARAALRLHAVIWLVSPQNPLKTLKASPLSARIASVRRFARRGDKITGFEAELGSPYTVDTLRALRRRHPSVRFFWLIGSDNLLSFHRWREWRKIPQLAEVVVVPRPGSTLSGRTSRAGRFLARSGRCRFLDAPLNAASSTALRDRANGSP